MYVWITYIYICFIHTHIYVLHIHIYIYVLHTHMFYTHIYTCLLHTYMFYTHIYMSYTHVLYIYMFYRHTCFIHIYTCFIHTYVLYIHIYTCYIYTHIHNWFTAIHLRWAQHCKSHRLQKIFNSYFLLGQGFISLQNKSLQLPINISEATGSFLWLPSIFFAVS